MSENKKPTVLLIASSMPEAILFTEQWKDSVNVKVTVNSAQALRQLEKGGIDAIVADLYYPEHSALQTDGLENNRKLTELLEKVPFPILFQADNQNDVNNALAKGANVVLKDNEAGVARFIEKIGGKISKPEEIQKPTILLVWDNDYAADLISSNYAEKANFIRAKNPSEAQEILASEKSVVDGIVTQNSFTKHLVTGVNLIKSLDNYDAMQKSPKPPVMLLTNSKAGIIESAIAAGATHAFSVDKLHEVFPAFIDTASRNRKARLGEKTASSHDLKYGDKAFAPLVTNSKKDGVVESPPKILIVGDGIYENAMKARFAHQADITLVPGVKEAKELLEKGDKFDGLVLGMRNPNEKGGATDENGIDLVKSVRRKYQGMNILVSSDSGQSLLDKARMEGAHMATGKTEEGFKEFLEKISAGEFESKKRYGGKA